MDSQLLYNIACLALLFLGTIAHFLKKLAAMNKAGQFMTPKEYWIGHPYQSSLSLIGAILGYVMLLEIGDLSLINAFLVGYMADSIIEVAGQRKITKLSD